MVTTLENNGLIGWLMRKNNRAARVARTKYNSCTTEREKFVQVDKSTQNDASNITITICLGED